MRIRSPVPFSFLIMCLSEALWPPPSPTLAFTYKTRVTKRSYKSLLHVFVTKNCIVIWVVRPSNADSVALGTVITVFHGFVWICGDRCYMWRDWPSEWEICGIGRGPYLALPGEGEKFSCTETDLPRYHTPCSPSSGKPPGSLAPAHLGGYSQHWTMLFFNNTNNWNLPTAKMVRLWKYFLLLPL